MKKSLPDTLRRINRHLRITRNNARIPKLSTPPFFILFVNSTCNLKCEHCFYWRNLNRRDDLRLDEIVSLSRELGRIENLNISGGEPFIREDIGEVCRHFILNNRVEQIYIPTNAYFTDKIVQATSFILREPSLKILAIEISLDGTADFHNRLRGSGVSFQKAMETYDALASLQKSDARLRIHAVSTVSDANVQEVRELTQFLYERCSAMDHHDLALIRGDRKNPSLQTPSQPEYQELYSHLRQIWAPREKRRFGGIVEPLLHWSKMRTVKEQRQVIPCRAGILSGVVFANGDVSFCETLVPLGNMREKSFREIWNSEEAEKLRRSIKGKECYCTNEIFMWPSIVFQYRQLAKAMFGAKVWRNEA
jgi:MoaA/NifB/PqqE/SkfB family radical SAM enzyme